MFAFLLPHTEHEILISSNSLHRWRNVISENRLQTSLLKRKLLEFWKVFVSTGGDWISEYFGVTYQMNETLRHSDSLRSERHANIHFSALSPSPRLDGVFLLLINMKTHKTFDGVENHRRLFFCLKWARKSERRKEWKARRERWKQKFNDNSPDLNV